MSRFWVPYLQPRRVRVHLLARDYVDGRFRQIESCFATETSFSSNSSQKEKEEEEIGSLSKQREIMIVINVRIIISGPTLQTKTSRD